MTGTLGTLILANVYCDTLLQRTTSLTSLSRQLKIETELIEPTINKLYDNGSLIKNNNTISLTELGRRKITVVMTGGVFDLIHIGHLFTLKQAKLLGDVLVVVITTDNNVIKLKKRKPTNNEQERAQIVANIKDVDIAIIGNEKDFMQTVKQIRPDIIALGYDQYFKEDELRENLEKSGCSTSKIVRLKEYIPNKSTTKIMQDIIQRNIRS